MHIIPFENVIVTADGKVDRKDPATYGIFGFKLNGIATKEEVDKYAREIVLPGTNSHMTTFKPVKAYSVVAVVIHQTGVAFTVQQQTEELSPKCLELFKKLDSAPFLTTPGPRKKEPASEKPAAENIFEAGNDDSAGAGKGKGIPAPPVGDTPQEANTETTTEAVGEATNEQQAPGAKPKPKIITPREIVLELRKQLPDAAPMDLLMSARSQYLNHYANYMQDKYKRPINIIKNTEWEAEGIEPFKIQLPDLDGILGQNEAPTQNPTEGKPAEEKSAKGETVKKETVKGDNMVVAINAGTYVKVIDGDMKDKKGIVKHTNGIQATVELDDGQVIDTELSCLTKSRRTDADKAENETETETTSNTSAEEINNESAKPVADTKPDTSGKTNTKQTKSSTNSGAKVQYRYKLALGKGHPDFTDETAYDKVEDCEKAAQTKVDALKSIIPTITPVVTIDEIKLEYSYVKLGEDILIEGSHDEVTENTVKLLQEKPVTVFTQELSYDVKNRTKFTKAVADKTGLNIKIIRLLFPTQK